ncbi:MAG: PAS domain S-box protein [Methylococcaceae bacterium]|nr:PAS domain S-box protein [Methylococcaceae bacterium]
MMNQIIVKRFNLPSFLHYINERPLYIKYGLALLTVALAAIVTRYIPIFGQQAVFLLFSFAIIQSAFWFGRGPGILATILSLIVVNSLILRSMWNSAPQDALILNIGFCLLAIIFITTISLYLKLTKALLENRQDLDHAQAIGKTGSWRMNIQSNELRWSDETYRIFGVSTGISLTYQSFLAFVHADDREYVDRRWQAALNGEPYDIEHRIIVAGKVKWVRETAVLEFDKNGNLLGGFGTTSDITEQKQNQLALLQSQQRYEGIIDSAMDAVITIDEKHAIFVFNAAAEKMFGYSAKEIIGDTLARILPERFRGQHTGNVEVFSLSGVTSRKMGALGIMTGLRKNGEEFPIEVSISQVSTGGDKSFTAILRDISERIAAEQALKEQINLQNQLAKVAESVPGLICSFRLRPDGTSGMPYASSMFKSIYGINHEEVKEDFSPIFACYHPQDIPHIQETIAESARTLQPWQDTFRYRHPIKGEIWIEGHSIPQLEADGSILWHGYIQDVTERKQVEAELKERIERYELVLDGAQDAIWDWDVKNKRVHYSPRWKELRGYSQKEISDSEEEWSEGIHPEDKSPVLAALQSHMEGKVPVFCEEYRILCKDGSYKWILDRGIAQKDSTGQVVRMAGSESDITARKLAEVALQERENELRLIMDATPALISYLDLEFRYKRVNKTYRDWFGFQIEDVIGKQVQDIIGNDAWTIVQPYLERARSGEHVSFDYRIPYGTGQPRWVHGNYIPNTDLSGTIRGIVVHVVDIDARIQAEEKIALLNKNLQHRVKELQAIFDTVPVGLAIADDATGHHIHGNVLNTQMLGLPPGSDLSKAGPLPAKYKVMLAGRELEPKELPMQRAVRGESVTNQILDIHRTDGRIVTLLSTAVPLFNEDGTIRGAVGAFQDITALKKSEAALRESEERGRLAAEKHIEQLQTHQLELEAQNVQLQMATKALETSRTHYLELYDFAPVAYLTLSTDGLINEINLAGANLLGDKRKNLINRQFSHFITKESSDSWYLYFNGTQQDSIELSLTRKDGTKLYVQLNSEKKDSNSCPLKLRISLTDITERMLATKALNESEERMHLATETTGVGIWEWNVLNNRIRWDAEMFRIYGVLPTEDGFIQYDTWRSAVLPEDLDKQEQIMQETVRQAGHSNREFRIKRAEDNAVRYIQAVETARKNDEGQVEWLVGTNLDISERTLTKLV